MRDENRATYQLFYHDRLQGSQNGSARNMHGCKATKEYVGCDAPSMYVKRLTETPEPYAPCPTTHYSALKAQRLANPRIVQ